MSSIELTKEDLGLTEQSAGSEALLALWRDFRAGRMAHAVLLTGESGVGKKTLARYFAQALLCEKGTEGPCGQCRGCRRFLARTHPDAVFPAPLPKEKTIKIDSLREMIENLSHHSLEGGRRVIVIENAERMTPQAQNCVLKTLEEAPADVYFLLTCDVESALLPTVRSRCRIVRVQPWPEERVKRALQRQGVPADRAETLGRYCEGSLGRALQMQQEESYWAAREAVQKTFLAVTGQKDIAAAVQALQNQRDQGDRMLDIMEQEVRALLHGKATGAPGAGADFPPLWQGASEKSLCRILEALLTFRRQRGANVNFAAAADHFMQIIVEETKTWQA